MFKDDYANLLFRMEAHLEEIIGLDEYSIPDKLIKLNLNSKEMEWFLSYSI